MIDSSSPNQPIQNYEIVNPGLESQVAQLLPSVAGYGGNLRATNTIIPIVDLTAAAEGSSVSESLAQALAFGSQTSFSVVNTSTDIVTNTGFFRVFGCATVFYSGTVDRFVNFTMSDGVTDKIIYGVNCKNGATNNQVAVNFDFIVFMDAGITLKAISNNAFSVLEGSTRQIATKNGTIVTPSGF